MSIAPLVKLPYVCLIVISKVMKSQSFSILQKVALFRTMILLWIKATLTNNSDHLVHSKVLKFRVSAYGYHTLFYLLDEIFLKGIYRFDSETEHPHVVDCGANIGISALYFKFLFPECKIDCFEPNPIVFELLKQNVQNNGLDNITLHNIALSNKDQFLDFYVGEEKGSFISSIDDSRGGTKIEVPAKRLSDFLEGKKIDLIKIDVEGSEWEIIKDLDSAECLGITPQYIIEYHHNLSERNVKFGQFLDYFEKNGFVYSVTSEPEKTGDFQCLMLYILTTKK